MEGADKADEPRPPRGITCELDRGLDAFGARVGIKDAHIFFHRRDLVDLFAQADHRVVVIVGRDMDEFCGLLLDGLDDFGMRVAGGKHGDAGGEINVAVAVHVPTFSALAMIHDERVIAWVGRRRVLLVAR
jgi:hypothetical protein